MKILLIISLIAITLAKPIVKPQPLDANQLEKIYEKCNYECMADFYMGYSNEKNKKICFSKCYQTYRTELKKISRK